MNARTLLLQQQIAGADKTYEVSSTR